MIIEVHHECNDLGKRCCGHSVYIHKNNSGAAKVTVDHSHYLLLKEFLKAKCLEAFGDTLEDVDWETKIGQVNSASW